MTAIDRYNVKWSGETAKQCRDLYAAAVKGKSPQFGVQLQDTVLASLGDGSVKLSQTLPVNKLSPAAKAWYFFMLS